MDLTQFKAIVFDLEGTLLDRKKSREKFIEEQFERFHDYFDAYNWKTSNVSL